MIKPKEEIDTMTEPQEIQEVGEEPCTPLTEKDKRDIIFVLNPENLVIIDRQVGTITNEDVVSYGYGVEMLHGGNFICTGRKYTITIETGIPHKD